MLSLILLIIIIDDVLHDELAGVYGGVQSTMPYALLLSRGPWPNGSGFGKGGKKSWTENIY